MKRMIGLMAVLAVAGFGCGDDDGDLTIDLGPVDTDMGGELDMNQPDMNRPDTGPGVGCGIGEACDMVRGCRLTGATCVELPGAFDVGGPMDPVIDHPDGEDTPVPSNLFGGGYCTTSFPFGFTSTTCDPNADDNFCTDCASCVDLFGTGTDGICMNNCEASLTDNGGCRDGYECLLNGEVCLGGCLDDNECRISREETNNVPGTQFPQTCMDNPADCTPADCGDPAPVNPDGCASPATNYDRLVYDTSSSAVCNPTTFRCEGAPSNPAASGGDTCTEDTDCEAEGFCIEEQPIDDADPSLGNTWLGGSCTKFRCDIAGNECANDGICQEAGVGVFACFQGCTVGGYAAASDPATWVAEGAAQGGCRDGYGCVWNQMGVASVENNGVCLPIEYDTTVTTPNIGEACTEDSDCFSPFGNGFCITDDWGQGYCSVRDCGAPWFDDAAAGEAPVCGSTGTCVGVSADTPNFGICFETCTTADECGTGYGCIALTADGSSRGCWFCGADADCRTGERCNGTTGQCVPE